MTDRFFALTHWSAPWREGFKVIKMYDNESLGGVGWVSFAEYPSRAAARLAARIAKRLVDGGMSPDDVEVMFNSTI